MNEGHDLDRGVSDNTQRNSEAEEMQLPIERIHTPFSSLAFPQMDVQGKKTCAFCEYLLHYLQQVITAPSAEVIFLELHNLGLHKTMNTEIEIIFQLFMKAEVKQVIDKVCLKLPSSVKNTCNEFIDTYGDAVVAILANEIDPATVNLTFQLNITD